MTADQLELEWLPGRYAVCRLEPTEAVPEWATPGRRSLPATGLLSITRTKRELSIVIDESQIPATATIKTERGFVAMRIVGVLDFSLVGVIARLTAALAEAKIPVFAISTYDTDILLIKAADVDRANQRIASVAKLAAMNVKMTGDA